VRNDDVSILVLLFAYHDLVDCHEKSLKLLWSVLPQQPTAPDARIDAHRVPLAIRRQAYRVLGKKLHEENENAHL
jgi:hypothetical protein